jgi:Protein of unknown function (DUF4013)
MSEFVTAPPPPPPPPPSSPAQPSFDFVKPFGFVFQDPRWLNKVLIGGLFQIASVFIVGIFFVMGYCARLTRNVIAGMESPLPEWDDLGEYFVEGLRLFCVVLVYAVPLAILAAVVFIPAAIMSSSSHDVAQNLGGGMMACAWCLFFPISLVMAVYLPAALLFSVVERSFGAAFEFGRILRFIRDNAANYILAFVVYMIARFAVPLGLIIFCIGVFFTGFWALLVATFAFAQAYRMRKA